VNLSSCVWMFGFFRYTISVMPLWELYSPKNFARFFLRIFLADEPDACEISFVMDDENSAIFEIWVISVEKPQYPFQILACFFATVTSFRGCSLLVSFPGSCMMSKTRISSSSINSRRSLPRFPESNGRYESRRGPSGQSISWTLMCFVRFLTICQ
jgi:hypothetical protein